MKTNGMKRGTMVFIGVSAAFCAAVVVGAVSATYDSVDPILRALRGDPLVLDAYRVNLGDLRADEDRVVEFRISNRSKSEICLLGSRSSCTCVVTDDLPRQIGAGTAITFVVKTRGKKLKPGRFHQNIGLYTNCREQPTLTLQISGNLVAPVVASTTEIKS